MRIAIDIDEVLGELIPTFLAYYAEAHGRSFPLERFTTCDWWTHMDVPKEELLCVFDEFAQTERFARMPPVAGAIEAIARLRAEHSLIVITSRPQSIAEKTEAWLETHFPQAFEKVHFTNQFRKEGFWQSKAQVCMSEGVDIIIEDNIDYALECAEQGISALLFAAPWNARADIPASVVRVANWDEAIAAISRRDA